MNWVGGSRKRFLMKNDAKKQREFFEKRKMHQKLKTSGPALPASPRRTSATSMDLVTLFIVNQIASKKEIKDLPKVAVFGSLKAGSKHGRNESLVLPMSPCSPSQLSLEDQAQYSVQGTRKKKSVIPEGFKRRQLSPVLESAFSDSSAPDYLPRITDPLSPFFSASSAPSGQGIFSLEMNLQPRQTQAEHPLHYSPSPWDTSGPDQTKPFSQPRGMADSSPWSCGSNRPFFQLETPTAARVLFRGSEPDDTGDQAGHKVTFSFHQPEDTEPMLDFTLNQPEPEHQFEGDVFRGFTTDECGREASDFGRGKKIYLKDEAPTTSSTPQTFPDSQCMEVEGSNYMQLSNCPDVNFSRLEHNNGPVNGCEYSPSYSCGRGYYSSDSCDDEECCQPCLQAASSHMNQACCAESLTPNLDSQGNPKQRHTNPTPLPTPQINVRDNPKVMDIIAFHGKALGSHTAQFASPQTQSSEPCECKKASNETRDAGTQTVHNPTAETREASTQCSAVEASSLPPVGVSVQHPATGRQADPAAEPSAHTSSSGTWSRDKHTPWTLKKTSAGSLSSSSNLNKCTDGRVILQRPINPFQDALRKIDGRGKENREGGDGNSRLMKDLSDEVREEVTSGSVANRLSEETETLQEIADILLLLKQRKEVRN